MHVPLPQGIGIVRILLRFIRLEFLLFYTPGSASLSAFDAEDVGNSLASPKIPPTNYFKIILRASVRPGRVLSPHFFRVYASHAHPLIGPISITADDS